MEWPIGQARIRCRPKMLVHRETRCKPARPNEAWSLDFVHDQFRNGETFRMLAMVDVFSREAPAIEVGQRLREGHVVAVLIAPIYRGEPGCREGSDRDSDGIACEPYIGR